MKPLKIALFTYSTKPRGGVVHTLNLAENLARLNHNVHIYSLSSGSEYFRHVEIPYTLIPCPAIEYESIDEKVESYIRIYTEYMSNLTNIYDIYHAEDCISANALLNLREMGLIKFYARTVHHIDDFTSNSLIECQLKSILEPDYMITVSNFWDRELRTKYSLSPTVINNGVDFEKFDTEEDDHSKAEAKGSFSLGDSKVILSVGGIEPRKNSITTLRAFNIAMSYFKTRGEKLVWLIGGGETLFDYRAYREEFFSELNKIGLELDNDVVVLGCVPEDSMKILYNAADVFVFPSVKEGWGLVVHEAMAAGLPVIASDIEPMTEYLINGENSILVAPMDFEALSLQIIKVLESPGLRSKLVAGGKKTAQKCSWNRAALKHVEFYDGILSELSS